MSEAVIRRPMRRGLVFLVVGMVGTFGIAALVASHRSGATSSGAVQPIGGVGEVPHGPPLAGGTEVTFSQAASMTKQQMLLPQTSLASDSSIKAVYARSENPDVLVQYDSGVQAEIRTWALVASPDEHWKALMSDGLPGSIENVSGQDMYIMPPGGRGGVGSVNFVTPDGVWVTVYGDGTLDAGQLQALAVSSLNSQPR